VFTIYEESGSIDRIFLLYLWITAGETVANFSNGPSAESPNASMCAMTDMRWFDCFCVFQGVVTARMYRWTNLSGHLHSNIYEISQEVPREGVAVGTFG